MTTIVSNQCELTMTLCPRKDSDCDLSVGTCSTASLSDHDRSTCSSSSTSSNASCDHDATTTPPLSPTGTTTKRRRRGRGRRNRSNKTTDSSSNQTKRQQQQQDLSPTEQEQYIAMDCEMVGVLGSTTWGYEVSALARVTLIDWNGRTLLDEYVHQPPAQVVDYRTAVSGICPEHLVDAPDISTVRETVLDLIRNKIVVGHALKNDFHALGIRHPWYLVRDTAKYEPFMKTRDGVTGGNNNNSSDNTLWPRKLKELARCKLQRDIQLPGVPHSPYEDALAALDLYKKVRVKFEKVIQYKMQRTAEIVGEQQQQ